MGKASALLYFQCPFPSEHNFCSHPCYSLWTSSPSSQILSIRIGMTHVYKLQTWMFKPESVRLLFA